MSKNNQPKKKRSRAEKKRREFLGLLRWLEAEGPQATADFENFWQTQRGRWAYWQHLDRRMLARRPGLTEDMTGTNSAEVYAWRKSLYYARRMRYIETQKRGNRLMIALTDVGRRTLFRHATNRAPQLPAPWIILVLFDIPEQERQTRHLLRAFLREYGYTPLQQSAWYTINDTYEQMQYFLTSLHIEQWVTVLRAEHPALHRKAKA